EPAEELELDRDREILISRHRLGRLRVQHRAAVPVGPLLDVRSRLADEAILDPQTVVRERRSIEEMAEAPGEIRIAVVRDRQQAVLDAERIGVVVAERMNANLYDPAVEIPPVEKRYPILGARILAGGARRCDERRERKQAGKCRVCLISAHGDLGASPAD